MLVRMSIRFYSTSQAKTTEPNAVWAEGIRQVLTRGTSLYNTLAYKDITVYVGTLTLRDHQKTKRG